MPSRLLAGSLLELPSRLFYDGTLLERADRAQTSSLLSWEVI